MKRSRISFALLLSATLAIGFWIGRASEQHRHSTGKEFQKVLSASPAVLTAAKQETDEATRRAQQLNDLAEKLATIGTFDGRRVGTSFRLLASLTPDEARRLLPAVEKNTDTAARGLWRGALLEAWARDEPAAALAYAQSISSRREKAEALLGVARGWAEKDSGAAFQWSVQLPAGTLRQQAMEIAFRELALADPDKALEHSKDFTGARWVDVSIIFRKLSEKNGPSAVDRALQLKGSQRLQALEAAAGGWAARDPQAAVAWAAGLNDINARNTALPAALSSWAMVDPMAAKTWIEQLPDGKLKEMAWDSIVSQWVQADPGGAIAYAQSLPSSVWQSHLLQRMFQEWAQQDSAAALDFVQTLPEAERNRTLRNTIPIIAMKDPTAASKMVEAMPAGNDRASAVSAIATYMAVSDPRAALDWLETLPDSASTRSAIQGISWQIAQSDPRAAANFIDKLPEGSQRNNFIQTLAMQWGQTDFKAALSWAQQLPEGDGRRNALVCLAPQWVQADPTAALQFARTLGDASGLNLFETLGRNLGSADSTSAMGYAGTLGDGAGHDAFVSGIAGGMAEISPEAAARFVSTLPPGGEQDKAALSVVSAWALTDPKAASAWVTQFPEGAARDESIQTILSTWASAEPQAAADWLGRLPEGASRDHAAANFISQVVWQFPDMAAEWADKIADQNQRDSEIETVARQWLKMDRQAAQTWLLSTPLSGDRKQQLLNNHDN